MWRKAEKTTDLSEVTDNCCVIVLYQVHRAWAGFELTKLVVIGTDFISSCKSNYHIITATTSSWLLKKKLRAHPTKYTQVKLPVVSKGRKVLNHLWHADKHLYSERFKWRICHCGIYVANISSVICTLFWHNMYRGFHEEVFEDTKGVISIRKSKKNRQHNGQKKKCKRTNNDLHCTKYTHKTKDRVTRIPLKTTDPGWT